MSSSPKTLREFVATSFIVLQTEQPLAYALLCQKLAHRSLLVQIDDESCLVAFSPTQAWVGAGRTATVRIATSKRTVLDVLNARCSLEEAIHADAMRVRGATIDLAHFNEGLSIYVLGAVRCVGFPVLYDWYRHKPPDA